MRWRSGRSRTSSCRRSRSRRRPRRLPPPACPLPLRLLPAEPLGLEGQQHDLGFAELVVVRALSGALLGRRVDLLDLLDELQRGLVELVPALRVELERGAREVRFGAVEAALGG